MFTTRIYITFVCICSVNSFCIKTYSQSVQHAELVQTSQDFLYGAKTNEHVDSLVNWLSKMAPEVLEQELVNDDFKKAFWINIYNAYVVHLVKQDSSLLKNKKFKFFSKKQIPIAGRVLSLNQIEHGLLRKSRPLIGLGHVQNPFPSSFEKTHRVENLDTRIHFALNCGAKSCPPIAFYEVENISSQLDEATHNYLNNEVKVDDEGKILYLPKVMHWYTGDFGSKKVKKKLVQHYCKNLSLNSIRDIKYLPYDWTLSIGQFVD